LKVSFEIIIIITLIIKVNANDFNNFIINSYFSVKNIKLKK